MPYWFVDSFSELDASKPRMEISMGCACSISMGVSTGSDPNRKA